MIPGSANPLLLASAAAGGYSIQRSLRFNSSDSAYLSRTPASAGNRKTWTWAGWVKRCSLSPQTGLFAAGTNANNVSVIYLDNTGKIWYYDLVSGAFTTRVEAAAVFRDFSAWYHIVVAVDTTQATASNRVRLYVNNTQLTTFTTATYPAQNFDTQINTTTVHTVNKESDFYANYGNMYLADIHFIDGQALDPTSFGEFDTNGIWQPKAYTGSYGTNGGQLKFEDNSSNTATTLGKDTSGNGNNWTPNNLSVTAGAGNDSLVDVPTNGAQTDTGAGGEVRGNYCTWNPTDTDGSVSYANGNLEAAVTNGSTNSAYGTISLTSGKWYWEVVISGGNGSSSMIGVAEANKGTARRWTGANGWYYYETGVLYNNLSSTSYGSSYTNGDVIGVALDMDNGNLVFYKNNTSQGTAYSSGTFSGKTIMPAVGNGGGATVTYTLNAGQRPFAYTAPSGFKALNTANLPAPLVTKPSTVFDTKLYTGNGGTQTISGLGFSPDLVWIKNRAAADNHKLTDIVRGATEELESNTTDAEATNADGLTQFNADGFDLGDDDEYNTSAEAYVAWAWDAGSSTVTNTVGSISSQVRANASAGFSVVGWNYPGGTGASTIGHGLGVKPGMIILKNRDTSGNWIIYHSGIGATKTFRFTTAAASTESDPWNNTEPTSTVFSIGAASWHGSGNIIAYCFAPVAGYSSFGSYVGNGSSDGSFVYTGFRPRWVMVKRTDSASNWTIWDTSRDPYNYAGRSLYPNLSNAEDANTPTGGAQVIDVLSNGFKLRDTGGSGQVNASGGTYIWASFAEHPFQYARAR
jgi:hypothetical protein